MRRYAEECDLRKTVHSVTVYITATGKILGVFPTMRLAEKFADGWRNWPHGEPACSFAVDGFEAYPWFEPAPALVVPLEEPKYSYVVLEEVEDRYRTDDGYENVYRWEVLRVYSTKGKAEAYTETFKRPQDYKIEEVELDAA
jgi:hypothetical protein